jgi:hypothetical protein
MTTPHPGAWRRWTSQEVLDALAQHYESLWTTGVRKIGILLLVPSTAEQESNHRIRGMTTRYQNLARVRMTACS